MAVEKDRTGVDRGSPVNKDFPSSRKNTGEILSTPVQGMAAWVRAHEPEVRGWPAVAGVDRRCLVDACDRSVFASALCKTHYKHAAVTRRAAAKNLGAAAPRSNTKPKEKQ